MRWLRGLSLDLRSVALFRIALGLCVVADILTRIPQIDEFYTDRGVMPREAIFGAWHGTWAISIHFMSGQWLIQFLLFLVALVFAIGLVLGYRTRLCAIASWFLVMSVQVRSPLVLHGGDDLLRMLLFWSMFVPLNGRYSVDRMLNPSAPQVPVSCFARQPSADLPDLCSLLVHRRREDASDLAHRAERRLLRAESRPVRHVIRDVLAPVSGAAPAAFEQHPDPRDVRAAPGAVANMDRAASASRRIALPRLSCRARPEPPPGTLPLGLRGGLAGISAWSSSGTS